MDLIQKYSEVLAIVGAVALGLPALLSALIAFFMIVPGEQPEKALKVVQEWVTKVVEIIEKLSKKKAE